MKYEIYEIEEQISIAAVLKLQLFDFII